jgi:hypothetical protein
MPFCGHIWTNQREKAAERFKYIILVLGIYHDSVQEIFATASMFMRTLGMKLALANILSLLQKFTWLLAPSISGVSRSKIISTTN